MADNILKHETGSCQPHSERPETVTDHAPSMEVIHPAFAAMTFSITLTASQWCLFWRLLNVGSMLSDELLDSQPPPNQQASKTAHLWNKLSSEFAALLERGDIVIAKQQPAECAGDNEHSERASD